MSYCRFSSDDFRCDAYVYESDEGFMIHLAGNRVVLRSELPEQVTISAESTKQDISRWMERTQQVSAMVDEAEREPIDHPLAGETIVCASPGEAYAKLNLLRADGFRIPQAALDALMAEQRDLDADEQ